MAGKGGGAWKVAYADFVTAMMAFFLVMWLVSQKEGVKEAVAGYFREPFATYKSHEKGAAGTAKPVSDPMYGHTAQPQKRRLAISGDRTDYQFTVLFNGTDADLDSTAVQAIGEFAPMMTGKLNRIEVRGHCLRQPLPEGSPFADHWELCYARSMAVKKELQSHGIEPQRIRLSQAEGNEPLALNLAEDELRLNSRVDVILLPDLADIPWERRRKDAKQDAQHQSAVEQQETHEPVPANHAATDRAPPAAADHGHSPDHAATADHPPADGAAATQHADSAATAEPPASDDAHSPGH